MSRFNKHNSRNRWLMISGALSLVVFLAASISLAPADTSTDTHIKELILAKLAGLVSIHPERLAVEVSDGSVTLTGSVASVGEKQTIARIVGSISGVLNITNELSVRTVDHSEAAIAQEVTRLLQNRPKFRGGSIRVSVAGAEVTLSGTVKHNADRVDAEEIAGTAPGVTGVVNRLVVNTNGNIPDETIHSKVMSALRNPVTFGVVRDLVVEVVDGTVTLKGSVRRQSDRGQAERITMGIQGVEAVSNLITVEGS